MYLAENLRDTATEKGFQAGEIILILTAYGVLDEYLPRLADVRNSSYNFDTPIIPDSHAKRSVVVSYNGHLRAIRLSFVNRFGHLWVEGRDEYGIDGNRNSVRLKLTINTKPDDLRCFARSLVLQGSVGLMD